MKRDYEKYDSADFVADHDFIRWVIEPTADADEQWQIWLGEHPEKQVDIDDAITVVLAMHIAPKELTAQAKEDLWEDIRKKAMGQQQTLLTWIYRTAAVLLLGVGLFWLIGYGDFGNDQYDQVAMTVAGKRSILTLADGTKVWLNSESSLHYPSDFSGSELREVMLDGEAFFDVAENPNQPFVVHVQDMEVKVLGTAFNIKAYEEVDEIETTLLRGKVAVSNSENDTEDPLFLTVNEQAIYSKKSKELAKKQVAAAQIAAWKDGKLIFNNLSFEEIIDIMERWYGVTIDASAATGLDCHFTTSVEKESVDEVLQLFSSVSDMDYEMDKQLITITGNICAEK